jgi:hypothetical protein
MLKLREIEDNGAKTDKSRARVQGDIEDLKRVLTILSFCRVIGVCSGMNMG